MTSEKLIEETLRPLIDQVANGGWSENADPSDEEVLGVILSKFLKWEAGAIMRAAHSAFEDANFRARIELE